ncbi:MAG: hypothetical protein IPK87_05510 [Planctomycetes bacterium]|nr:hypothetical protein [Planctomycetota bacterium]
MTTGVDFSRAVACFRFEAGGGSVEVTGIQVTPGGSGDWVNDLDSVSGVECWLDDGDGSFSSATDARVAFAGGSTTPMAMTFSPTVQIASGSTADIWVVLNVLATAGSSLPETFSLALAATSDVSTAGATTIALGSPPPNSNTLTIVVFAVSSFFPLAGPNQPITISGSGFMSPFIVEIGGSPCSGTAVIDASGTGVTGLFSPTGLSTGYHVVVIYSGNLPPYTLPQSYGIGTFGTGTDDTGSDESCSTDPQSGFAVLGVLGVILSRLGLSLTVNRRSA